MIMAFEAGASSVSQGSVITRPQLITKRFNDCLETLKKNSDFRESDGLEISR
jgi:hypothetical protein